MAAKKNDAKGEAKADDFQSPIADNKLGTLAALVAASQSALGFLLMPSDEASEFVNVGFAETMNDDNGQMIVDDNGMVKTRSTVKGAEYSSKHPATPDSKHEEGGQPTQQTTRTATGFVRPSKIDVDDAVPMPMQRRSRREGVAYPFDTLEIGQSFHIAATEKAPDPAKSVASSVSAANLRHSEEVKGETVMARRKNAKTGEFEQREVPKRRQLREFVAMTVTKDDPRGAGVRVWRVELSEDGPDQDEGEGESDDGK